MKSRRIALLVLGPWLIAAVAAGAPPGKITKYDVPNSQFDVLYKPGTKIRGQIADTWVRSIGANAAVTVTADGMQMVAFDDGTKGNTVDIPGWTGTGMLIRFAKRFSDRGYEYQAVNGDNITSDPITTVTADTSYLLSVDIGRALFDQRGGTWITAELLADGKPIAAADVSFWGLDDFDAKRTTSPMALYQALYQPQTLAGQVGQKLSVKLGIREGMLAFTNVRLISAPGTTIPKP